MKNRSNLLSLPLVLLGAALVLSCNLANNLRSSTNSAQNTNPAASKPDPKTFMPAAPAGFTRDDGATKIREGDLFVHNGSQDITCARALTIKYEANAVYTTADGEKVLVSRYLFDSAQIAQKAIKCQNDEDTDFDGKETKEEIAADKWRYKQVEKLTAKSGEPLYIMQNLPVYPASDRAYWTEGESLYSVINYDKVPYKTHQTFALAKILAGAAK
ncbi:MAG: hypothetical protein JSS81_12655 [Acidobacteria bacterium]|nr:hypothetical protein [Acidobacteriota bacterium]